MHPFDFMSLTRVNCGVLVKIEVKIKRIKYKVQVVKRCNN